MVDRQEVLKGLKEIEDEAYCRWVHRPYVPDKLVTLFGKYLPSIVALLKEQEPLTIRDPGAICPNCKWPLYPEDHPNYCGNCGRAVKWDD